MNLNDCKPEIPKLICWQNMVTISLWFNCYVSVPIVFTKVPIRKYYMFLGNYYLKLSMFH